MKQVKRTDSLFYMAVQPVALPPCAKSFASVASVQLCCSVVPPHNREAVRKVVRAPTQCPNAAAGRLLLRFF